MFSKHPIHNRLMSYISQDKTHLLVTVNGTIYVYAQSDNVVHLYQDGSYRYTQNRIGFTVSPNGYKEEVY